MTSLGFVFQSAVAQGATVSSSCIAIVVGLNHSVDFATSVYVYDTSFCWTVAGASSRPSFMWLAKYKNGSTVQRVTAELYRVEPSEQKGYRMRKDQWLEPISNLYVFCQGYRSLSYNATLTPMFELDLATIWNPGWRARRNDFTHPQIKAFNTKNLSIILKISRSHANPNCRKSLFSVVK